MARIYEHLPRLILRKEQQQQQQLPLESVSPDAIPTLDPDPRILNLLALGRVESALHDVSVDDRSNSLGRARQDNLHHASVSLSCF